MKQWFDDTWRLDCSRAEAMEVDQLMLAATRRHGLSAEELDRLDTEITRLSTRKRYPLPLNEAVAAGVELVLTTRRRKGHQTGAT